MSSVRQTIVDNLETALIAVKASSSYPLVVKTVARHHTNLLDTDKLSLPCIVIYDPGETAPLVEDATHERFRMRVYLIGAVDSQDAKTLGDDMEKMMSFLHQFAASSPSLGDAVKQTRFVQIQSNQVKLATTNSRAISVVEIEIDYVCAVGTY